MTATPKRKRLVALPLTRVFLLYDRNGKLFDCYETREEAEGAAVGPVFQDRTVFFGTGRKRRIPGSSVREYRCIPRRKKKS